MLPQDRELAPLAQAQLAAWRAYAFAWYFRLELRMTDATHRVPDAEQYHLVCCVCENSITVLSSEGIGYMMCARQVLDAVTRHLRNVHRDMEAAAYGDYAEQNAAFAIDPRGGRAANGSNSHPG